jgi:hypothetical protein
VSEVVCFQIEAIVQIVSIGQPPPAWLINVLSGAEN